MSTHKCLSRSFAIKEFRLPDLGEKIKEAIVKKWHVNVGDEIDEFDTVAEVATDKLFTELPSPYKGRVHKLMCEEEESCNVGDVLIQIDVPDSPETVTKKPTENKVETVEKAEKVEQHVKSTKKVLASPAVRKLAQTMGIDLTDVHTDSPKGVIRKEDLYSHQDQLVNKKISTSPVKQKEPIPVIEQSNQDTETVPMKLFERGMAKSMTIAATVPHLNLHDEYDITQLEELRKQFNQQTDNKLSLFSFLVKSFSLALTQNPMLNSTYYPDTDMFSYRLNRAHNISIAIDSTQGLAAPNLKNVQSLSVSEISQQIKHLQALTAEGRLTMEYLEGGTIALSNIGTITGSFATPLNLPNQTCIVALGKTTIKPVYCASTDRFLPRKVLPVSFGCDHRVLDGATVARFSLAWKAILECPGSMLVQLK